MGILSAALRGIGRAARAPSAASTLGGAGLMSAAIAGGASGNEGEDAELQRARERVQQLQEEQQRLAGVLQEAEQSGDWRPFQRLVGANPDGRYGTETGAQANAERARIDESLNAEQERLAKLEADANSRSTRASPLQEIGREVAPWAGVAGGLLLGHGLRSGAVRNVARRLTARNTAANAMLAPNPVVPTGRGAGAIAERSQRAANLNEFWRLGGAGERVPYREAASARGFRTRPKAAAPSSLYPPDGPSMFRAADYGVMAGGAGEAALSYGLLQKAEDDLEEALEAAEKDQSEYNLARVERARDMVALAQGAMRLGVGVAAGRGLGAVVHRYPRMRPNVAGAEQQQMLMNRFLRGKR